MARVLVTADDCTGALEVAGELAERTGRPVRAVVGARSGLEPPGIDDDDLLVVDLASRHLPGPQAGVGIVEVVESVRPDVVAHKIDSTLRGNWAHELVAISRSVGRSVLLVPALPAAGRACRDGVVVVDGVPVADTAAGRDSRHPVRWSRPVDHLVAAGAADVAQVRTDAELVGWLDRDEPTVAVVDASTADDLDRIGARWRSAGSGTLLAGTASSIAAGIAAPPDGEHVRPRRPEAVEVLVVCGSLHPAARRQLAALVMSADPGDRIAVLTSSPPWPPGATVSGDEAARVAAALAERARRAMSSHRGRALVLVGGDTASALLDGEHLDVYGCLQPGTPWCRLVGDGQLVVTRSGGFGDATSLRRLVQTILAGAADTEV